jgi:hypothetical protein
MIKHPFSDPYQMLGLSPEADDLAVRTAYHERVRAGSADAHINAAYASIRTAADRERLRFTSLTSWIAQPPQSASDQRPLLDAVQVEAVVREFASLSEWELGDV